MDGRREAAVTLATWGDRLLALPSAGSQAVNSVDTGPMPDGEYARMRQYEVNP